MDSDQRKFDRIGIPDAYVNLYSGNNKFPFFSKYSGNFPLINLTKCGLCFKSEKHLSIGQYVEIRINTNHTRPFCLKVKVLWSEMDTRDHRYFTGVRIHPFGSVDGLNPLKCLKKLKELEQVFATPEVVN